MYRKRNASFAALNGSAGVHAESNHRNTKASYSHAVSHHCILVQASFSFLPSTLAVRAAHKNPSPVHDWKDVACLQSEKVHGANSCSTSIERKRNRYIFRGTGRYQVKTDNTSPQTTSNEHDCCSSSFPVVLHHERSEAVERGERETGKKNCPLLKSIKAVSTCRSTTGGL